MAGPFIGAGLMRNVGQEGVARRATCSRGAEVFMSNHTDHGLVEQHRALEVGRGNRQRLPREKDQWVNYSTKLKNNTIFSKRGGAFEKMAIPLH